MHVNDRAETLLADELERNANVLWQKSSAAADDERVHERVKLVDQVGGDHRCREVRATDGEIAVAGPDLARSLTDLGLIDEYRLYFRPFVLGRGKPFFAGPRPPLRLVASDRVREDTIRLTYIPA